MARKNFLVSGDGKFMMVATYFTEDNSQLFDIINEKKHRLEKSHFTSRILNHWEKEGLINDKRPSGKGWRMYSMMDMIWLNIISELRSFGYPLNKIKKVKESLIELFPKHKEKHELPYLEVYVALALTKRDAAYLLVFENGEALPAKHDEIVSALKLQTIGNHLKISINDILQKLFPKKDLSPIHESSLTLSKDEFELMFLVRTGNYESINIKRKNGKIEMLEATESIETDKRITEILQKGDYQNIEIKQANGKVVCIKRTIKKKL